MVNRRIIKGFEELGWWGSNHIWGMAGDDMQLLESTFVFTNGKKASMGLIALLIDEAKISIKGLATCGWKPIGTSKTVTKSEGNIVYTIDDQPALDLVIKYLGLNIDNESGDNVVANLGAYYPLQLEREDAPPVMRTAMLGNKQDRSLICAGNVPQGAKVRFSLPPDFDVIDTVVAECNDLKNEKDADVVIMFSCISRYLSFGVMTSEEIEQVKKYGMLLLLAFSVMVNLENQKGKHEFHNNTCCVVVLKEK
ncbi:MAG: FIST C-terminal domain-containing protein [Chitinophagaceae bacterium]|nr:FIST C-terminal domain-containing protein [Chitinophagaceae bacterium]